MPIAMPLPVVMSQVPDGGWTEISVDPKEGFPEGDSSTVAMIADVTECRHPSPHPIRRPLPRLTKQAEKFEVEKEGSKAAADALQLLAKALGKQFPVFVVLHDKAGSEFGTALKKAATEAVT